MATCAICHNQFQMPALSPPPAIEEPAEPPFEAPPEHPFEEPVESPFEESTHSDSDEVPRRRKRAGGNRGFTLFVILMLVVMPLITLVVGISLIASGSFADKQEQRKPPGSTQPKKKLKK
jgi:hypothetical protein